MEIIIKIIITIILAALLWKPFWRLVRASLENAHSRIIAFLGKFLAVFIIALFILLIQWIIK